MSKEDCDVLVNLLIIGDYAVGKTCLLCRYIDDIFLPERSPTTEIDFKVKRLYEKSKSRRIRVHLWDTAGQEKYQSLSSRVYRGANGVILVYDITKSSSFASIVKWIRAVRKHARPDVKLTLIGNKTDLEEKRQVSREQGSAFSEAYKVSFYETSAKSGAQVNCAFEESVSLILASEQHPTSSVKLSSYTPDNNQSCCCSNLQKEPRGGLK